MFETQNHSLAHFMLISIYTTLIEFKAYKVCKVTIPQGERQYRKNNNQFFCHKAIVHSFYNTRTITMTLASDISMNSFVMRQLSQIVFVSTVETILFTEFSPPNGDVHLSSMHMD